MTLSNPVNRGGTQAAIERAQSDDERGLSHPSAEKPDQWDKKIARRSKGVPLSHCPAGFGGGVSQSHPPSRNARARTGTPRSKGVIADV